MSFDRTPTYPYYFNPMRRGGFRTGVAFLVIGFVVGLTACTAGSAALLPTRVALLPTIALPTATSTPGDVPYTWTPPPPGSAELVDATPHPNAGQPAANASSADTPRATVPTSTAVPSRTPTPSVTPTPSPYVPLSTLLAGLPHDPSLGPSKLSIHIVRNNDPNIMEFVRLAQPAVIKVVDDFGLLNEVNAISPRTIIVGRINDDFIQNYVGEPEEAAQEYIAKHINTYLANPAVDYWEGWNEPDPPSLGHMDWYARFEQERVRLMAQYGLKSAIGGFPPGVPEVNEFAHFLPAVETAKQYDGILTVHEGDLHNGDLRAGYGSAVPGYPAYPDRGNMTFRYRWFYKELLEPANLVIPLVISELNFVGWGDTNHADFIAQCAWYDTEVRKDGYVIGFAIFTAGPIQQWTVYDINPILLDFAAYVRSQR
jgi:hypothetical protein